MLHELRAILLADIVWFEYSVTLNVNTERVILNKADFRPMKPHIYETRVIRILINRDNIAFCVRLILRGYLKFFDSLYFLLDATVSSDKVVTPARIPKIIIFVNDR